MKDTVNPQFDGARKEGRVALEPAPGAPAPYEQKLEFLSLWAGNTAAPEPTVVPTPEARAKQ